MKVEVMKTEVPPGLPYSWEHVMILVLKQYDVMEISLNRFWFATHYLIWLYRIWISGIQEKDILFVFSWRDSLC